jgi:hypothetical protein
MGQWRPSATTKAYICTIRLRGRPDSELLSGILGKYSFVVKERNVTGNRMTIAPHDQLAEQNRIETRRWYTP